MRPSTRENNGAIFLLRSFELGLTISDLDELTVGMVYDMLTEKANDQEKYPYKGTERDIESFFGGN